MGAEWFDATKTSVVALDNETMNDEEPDALRAGQVCISLGMDGAAVLVGTPEEIFGLATRIQNAAMAAPKFELIPDEDNDE